MKKSLRIALFCVFTFGATSVVSAQESYAGALNIFANIGDNTSVSANYEFALAKNFTISPEVTLPFDLNYMFAGARVDYYFDSLLKLNEPWDIWAGAGAGLLIGSAAEDSLNINFHIGGEYKFNETWGLILETGLDSANIGVGIHL